MGVVGSGWLRTPTCLSHNSVLVSYLTYQPDFFRGILFGRRPNGYIYYIDSVSLRCVCITITPSSLIGWHSDLVENRCKLGVGPLSARQLLTSGLRRRFHGILAALLMWMETAVW